MEEPQDTERYHRLGEYTATDLEMLAIKLEGDAVASSPSSSSGVSSAVVPLGRAMKREVM